MLHPAQKIASFFVAKKLIPAQDYEWAVYGLQRRLLAAVFYPILFFDRSPGLGCIFHRSVLCCLYQPAAPRRRSPCGLGYTVPDKFFADRSVRSVLIPADYSRMAGGGAFTGGNDRLSCDWPGRSLQ